LSESICILDYGSGNVASVRNALERLGYSSKISNEISDVKNASHLVLPGVGAFAASMEKIKKKLPLDEIQNCVKVGKPILGICVGMQVLAEVGYEYEMYSGLGLISGAEVVELPNNVAKPHVGWNSIEIKVKHSMVSGLAGGADFYFVHSYYISKIKTEYLIAQCDYGITFPAIVAKDNLIGVQFHPEKSQSNGDILLRNFVGMN